MPDKQRSYTELASAEPDLLRRMALINFKMDMLEDPEMALTSYNLPEGTYTQWAEKRFKALVGIVAQETGADPEQIADKDKRTPEQQQALVEASAREQLARMDKALRSNFYEALRHINRYCIAIAEAQGIEDIYAPLRDNYYPEEMRAGRLVNVPLAAALYFFATHADIDPRDKDILTADHKAELIEKFSALDEYYREHRAELHTERELLQAYLDLLNPAAAQETLERITSKRAETIEFPLDKVSATIWGLTERDTAGEVKIRAEKQGSKKEISILYSIDFDALGDDVTITKRLLPYDKRVYIAVSALFNAGNNIITLTQIYYAMGYTGRPGHNDLERINASIAKMLGANIRIDNKQEAAAYKYAEFVYKGSLLPYEQVEAVANGQLVDAAIHLFREPPVITFAKQRKQLTSIDVKLLQSPISKTDGNLLIDDYLIDRISRAKNGKQPNRILFKTLYEKAKITDKKQRQRAADKITRYLEHYKKCGMITRYTMEPDGITVYFT